MHTNCALAVINTPLIQRYSDGDRKINAQESQGCQLKGEANMYIGGGTVVLILIIVLIVFLVRR
jgi:hypothetical protein